MYGNLTADMEDFRLGTVERSLGGCRVYVTDMNTGCVLGGDAPVSNIWVGSVTIMGGIFLLFMQRVLLIFFGSRCALLAPPCLEQLLQKGGSHENHG